MTGVCTGCWYLIALFFGPFFTSIPATATTPVLIAVGFLLFVNVKRIDFEDARTAYPSFLTLFFIPFTSNTICGLLVGYTCYIFLSIFTMDFIDNARDIYDDYFVVNDSGSLDDKGQRHEVVEFETGPVAVPLPPVQQEPVSTARRASMVLQGALSDRTGIDTTMQNPVIN